MVCTWGRMLGPEDTVQPHGCWCHVHIHTHTLGNTLSVPDSSYSKASTHNTVPPAEEAVNVCLMRLCADKEVQRETQHSISSSPCEV